MNKHLKRLLIVFLALIVCVIGFTGFTVVTNRTLSYNCDIDTVFIPKGLANEYENNYMFTDGSVTWVYKLDHKEQTEIEAELESWKRLSEKEKNDICSLIEHYCDIDLSKLSDNLYECTFNSYNREPVEVRECLNTMTFLYDKTNALYYAVLIEI